MMNPTDESTIQIIACGGTIDKVYFDAKSDYQVGEPQVQAILELVRADVRYNIRSLFRKDSLDLTDEDRQQIRRAVQESAGDRVLITHGTDHMPETARALRGIAGKTIVLTGANTPASFIGSDAQFNVGSALAAVLCLPAGIYIVMNGRIHPGDRVKKNRQTSRFDPIV
jgi:L-asparaginase